MARTRKTIFPSAGEDVYPLLTDRRNVVVIADEAHRSQYGFKARLDRQTGEIDYGFAKHLRDALPNAAFIGFTGTPIDGDDVNTRAVFGDYIDIYDIYDISRAVEDGATVPIYYESRLARIELPEDEKPRIDTEIAELTAELIEDEAQSEQERLKRKWSTVEALVGAEKRLNLVAADLVQHFEDRVAALDGKAMIVCMSRRICVALYQALIALRPDWHADDDAAGRLKVVMTGSAADPLHWQPHIGSKGRRDLLAKRAKDPKDPLQLVIVRDMWLTGFDAPAMHTMYVDKPMHGHAVMQAIARVNRVFRDKPAGLVVDYIAIAQIIDRAVVSTEIVDILTAAGLTTPDIAILSEEFLAELTQMKKKNLALEALRKLLNDAIRSRSRSNVVETRRFSERLEEAIARYHTNAISTVEILQELIGLARDIRETRQRGEAEGLSADEIAFYDALAENQSAIEVMGNDALKVIAHELLTGLRGSITVDWSHRESARARMRVLVKRILRKYGYPPDLQDAAVQTVLAQAEALSAQWAA